MFTIFWFDILFFIPFIDLRLLLKDSEVIQTILDFNEKKNDLTGNMLN